MGWKISAARVHLHGGLSPQGSCWMQAGPRGSVPTGCRPRGSGQGRDRPPAQGWVTALTCLSPRRVESRPGFAAVELRLRNYYYDVVN